MGKKGIGLCRKKNHEGIQGQWHEPSSFFEVQEQVKGYPDTACGAYIMRRAYCAEKSGNREGFKEEFQKKGKFSEWAFAGPQGAYDKVASEDVGRHPAEEY